MIDEIELTNMLAEPETFRSAVEGLQVLKFGGTSVKNPARIKHVAEVTAGYSKNGPVLVVVSAMGDTTDYLLNLAKRCSSNPDQRELDLLLSTGEQISITLLTMMLHDLGIKARSLTAFQAGIITGKVHNNASIIQIKTENLVQSLSSNDVIVVAGFQGVTTEGDITTLGRGGSDTTAVALAAATGSPVCEIYTDVDGVYTADPAVVKDARLISRITYSCALELARMGAQIVHPRAVSLAAQYNIKLKVRNTFKPDHSGTTIDRDGDTDNHHGINSIALDQEQSRVTIAAASKQLNLNTKLTDALLENHMVADMWTESFNAKSGEIKITFAVNTSNLPTTLTILERKRKELFISHINSEHELAKVSLISATEIGATELAAKFSDTLNEHKIIIKMISTNENKISCLVNKSEAKEAICILHKAFGLAN